MAPTRRSWKVGERTDADQCLAASSSPPIHRRRLLSSDMSHVWHYPSHPAASTRNQIRGRSSIPCKENELKRKAKHSSPTSMRPTSEHEMLRKTTRSLLSPVATRSTRQSCEVAHRLSVLTQEITEKSKCRLEPHVKELVKLLCQTAGRLESPEKDTLVLGLHLKALVLASFEELTALLQSLSIGNVSASESGRLTKRNEHAALLETLQIHVVQAFLDVHRLRPAKTKNIMHELDYHYKRLETDVTRLRKDAEDFKLLKRAFMSGEGGAGLSKVLDIFVIDRKYEEFPPRSNQSCSNSLYYHGTSLRNLQSILQHGLKLVNQNTGNNGRSHGSGLYFTDTSSVAAAFCFKHPIRKYSRDDDYDDGYMLMAELCLGETSSKECPYSGSCTIVNHEVDTTNAARLSDGTLLPQSLSQVVVIQQECRIKLRYLVSFRQFNSDS